MDNIREEVKKLFTNAQKIAFEEKSIFKVLESMRDIGWIQELLIFKLFNCI